MPMIPTPDRTILGKKYERKICPKRQRRRGERGRKKINRKKSRGRKE
jgi:hypothetical protein